MKKIIVIGAGPAGVVCAIGLKKLNFEVTLINKKRPFSAIEGFSPRTIVGLRRAGCFNALNSIGEYLPRCVVWNKEFYQNNHEYIVHREIFDKALLEDAKFNKIRIINGSSKIINIEDSLVKIGKDISSYDFIVDARGRFAPRKTIKKSKSTSAFLVKYKKRNSKFQTYLTTSKYGWVWKAQDGDNQNYLQLTTDSKKGKYYLREIMKEKEISSGNTKFSIREASSYLSKDMVLENYLRVGDAACGVDPLSGNGVFQSLSTALLSPFVINTLLNGNNKDKEAAKQFYKNRVEDIFYRYTRIGREFYEKEKSYKTKFWKDRSVWPDYKKSHKEISKPYLKQGAVLISPFIKAKEVLITKDNPMGVWKLGNIDLVEVFKFIYNKTKEEKNDYINSLNLEKETTTSLNLWLSANNLFEEV